MKIYVVLDTNVIVSALITKNENSPTLKILEKLLKKELTPLYHKQIIEEYNDVLKRKKFNINENQINTILSTIIQNGIEVNSQKTQEKLIDEDDTIFYEIVMEKQKGNAYLITGNIKHFPIKPFIVTPKEFIEIMDKQTT